MKADCPETIKQLGWSQAPRKCKLIASLVDSFALAHADVGGRLQKSQESGFFTNPESKSINLFLFLFKNVLCDWIPIEHLQLDYISDLFLGDDKVNLGGLSFFSLDSTWILKFQ